MAKQNKLPVGGFVRPTVPAKATAYWHEAHGHYALNEFEFPWGGCEYIITREQVERIGPELLEKLRTIRNG